MNAMQALAWVEALPNSMTWRKQRLDAIDRRLRQIRRGTKNKGERRRLRAERDKLWAEYCGLKLANS